MRIGEVLRAARERAGLDLRAAEAQTKIRVRYLQALEDESWTELPSHAYAKGFLRTYAGLLGLDAEALVDEFRRQVEGGGADPAYPLGDSVLERRRRLGKRSPGRPRTALVAVVLIALVVAAIAAIGMITGGDDESEPPATGTRAGQSGNNGSTGGSADAQDGPVTVGLRVKQPVEVCLVSGGEALIDRQVLAAGSREEFTRERFELRFPTGVAPRQLRLIVDGRDRRLARSRSPAAYAIVAPGRIDRTKPPSKESCP